MVYNELLSQIGSRQLLKVLTYVVILIIFNLFSNILILGFLSISRPLLQALTKILEGCSELNVLWRKKRFKAYERRDLKHMNTTN